MINEVTLFLIASPTAIPVVALGLRLLDQHPDVTLQRMNSSLFRHEWRRPLRISAESVALGAGSAGLLRLAVIQGATWLLVVVAILSLSLFAWCGIRIGAYVRSSSGQRVGRLVGIGAAFLLTVLALFPVTVAVLFVHGVDWAIHGLPD